ncbi:uncharacterized protein LOC113234789 [Hyposmocoma kahamanoa]|uniref:uncharacterized protein LOC113234789 n=1 Tax=Hyposmocoma kahamanoa TaxID=1477025 RepID=UPI000E6D899B|nr:uncharacterized protein LOC113234789 [Hyposmocoma kahamanoa]
MRIIKNNSQLIRAPRSKFIIKPWITLGLLRCIRNRDLMHSKQRLLPNNETLKVTYKRYRNFCNKLLKKLKQQYERDQLNMVKNNSKKLWTTIKLVTNLNKQKECPHELLASGNSPISSTDVTNHFFASVGKHLAESIPRNITPFENLWSTSSTLPNSFVFLETDCEEIEREITNLKTDCSPGWDGISSKILKQISPFITPVLTNIINRCISTGTFPEAFKKSIVHPIYKAGDKHCANNYRPISILTSLSKVFERIINKRLVGFLETNSILARSQYGFRKHKSTDDAVHDFTDFLCYINELCQVQIPNCNIIAYADDTTLTFYGDSWEDVFSLAQKGFDIVNHWLAANSLTLNTDKTKYVPFCIRNTTSNSCLDFDLYAHKCSFPPTATCSCDKIERTQNIRYLGIIIDQNLSFYPHIQSLSQKIRKLIFVFKHLRHIADFKVLRNVYLALAQSLLTYCITSWGGAAKNKLIILERAQRCLLKVALCKSRLFPTSQLYLEANVLTVRQLYLLTTLIRQHAITPPSRAPSVSDNRRLFTSCDHNRANTSFAQKFFHFRASRLYNVFNKKLNIVLLCKQEVKHAITKYLLKCTYDETEKFLLIQT